MNTIFDKFGGIRAMAKHLSEAPSTVSDWNTKGRIPAGKQPDVLRKAEELGIEITAEDVVFPLGKVDVDHDDADTTAAVAPSHGKTGEVSAQAVSA